MESSAEVFAPSPLYARAGWFGVAGAAVCVVCGLRAPFAFIPAFLCAVTSVTLFLLAKRPRIVVEESHFMIGTRTIAWAEFREVNSTRLVSPLVLRLRLTNNRRKTLVFPGEPDRISKLLYQIRRNSLLATFDGVSYKDYWTWSSMAMLRGNNPSAGPVRMVSHDDEEEIERLYRQLKSVGHLDSRSDSEKS